VSISNFGHQITLLYIISFINIKKPAIFLTGFLYF
jgi:hypothetical protein